MSGYQWESDKLPVRHHKREPIGLLTMIYLQEKLLQ